MSTMADVVFYFGTNQDTMIAGKTLHEANIVARMVPRPAGVNCTANLVLRVASEFEQLAARALSGAGVAFEGVIK